MDLPVCLLLRWVAMHDRHLDWKESQHQQQSKQRPKQTENQVLNTQQQKRVISTKHSTNQQGSILHSLDLKVVIICCLVKLMYANHPHRRVCLE